MIKHKRIGIIAALLMAVSVLFLSIGYFNPSILEGVVGSSEPPYVSVMDKTKVMDIQIIVNEKDWANMLENATAKEYIPATVIINGEKIKNVGIRPKGNSSLNMVALDENTDRYSFKIEFDHYVSGQTWLGLDKISFNNIHGDASYMKEYLAYDIMDYVGVETPRYAFSNISVNGEAWGFYLAIEALEDSYAERVYGNDHGKLYKPENILVRDNQMNEFEFAGGAAGGMAGAIPQAENSPAEGQIQEQVQPPQEEQLQLQAPQEGQPPRDNGQGIIFGSEYGNASLQYTDEEFESYAAMFDNAVFDISKSDQRRLIKALKNLSAGEDLESVVDVEATLKYFAAHTVTVNLDSYISPQCHNYYLYEKGGQLTMLPWDYNFAFGAFMILNVSDAVNFPIDTPVSGLDLEERPILAKLLEVPEYMALYHEYLWQIVDGYFNSGLFEQTIHSIDTLISPYIEADPSAFFNFAEYKDGVAALKTFGILRAASIEGQLDGTIPATTQAQIANPAALIDSTSIDFSALSMMGGLNINTDVKNVIKQDGGRVENGEANMPPNGDMPEDMERVMEIIGAAGDGELTEDQLDELQELGITEEQIAMFRNMGQGNFGDGGMIQGNMEGGAAGPQGVERPEEPSIPATPEIDSNAWIVLSGCVTLLLGGLLFVVFFKRRKIA